MAYEFSPAQADAINPGTASTDETPTLHATFVDNNIMANITDRIQLSIQRSSDSSYLLFGYPQRSILTPCLAEEKSLIAAAWCMDQISIDTETCNI